MRMRDSRKYVAAAIGIWLAALLLPACGERPLVEKEPKELLRLSVSGLSGIDAYRFSGQSGMKTGERVTDIVRFGGKVEHHDQIRLEASSVKQVEQYTVRDPMAYLSQVQAEARRTEVKQAESDARSTMLVMYADSELARKRWVRTLKAAFDDAIRSGVRRLDGPRGGSTLPPKTEEEIRVLRRQMNEMLQSLSVETTYRLVIDRKKLLPGKLTEDTVLHYKREGRTYSESRQLTMEIKPDLRR
ncbi:hypothetical protein [Paenibacillus methanolicus]|uniref:Uncharacterized protein n=1 Tax=Paenibacillus methanolicus TaxID=582686 RepID=A0A5S5C075_9BACL|nr:hypothetical protein [Paenibacillus methanolicus]TYP72687.1 hypothetical protein BCM02_108342 [Paenibacillus methanolicus]